METQISKRHRNQEKMFVLVSNWKVSGLSQQEFCKQHKVPYNTFQYWYRKYNLIHSMPLQSDFIEVKPALQLNPVEIIFPSGVRIVLSSADLVIIKALIG